MLAQAFKHLHRRRTGAGARHWETRWRGRRDRMTTDPPRSSCRGHVCCAFQTSAKRKAPTVKRAQGADCQTSARRRQVSHQQVSPHTNKSLLTSLRRGHVCCAFQTSARRKAPTVKRAQGADCQTSARRRLSNEHGLGHQPGRGDGEANQSTHCSWVTGRTLAPTRSLSTAAAVFSRCRCAVNSSLLPWTKRIETGCRCQARL